MNSQMFWLASVAVFAGTLAGAETMHDRASGTLGALAPITDILKQDKVEETVKPYTTDNPPETDLSHTEFMEESYIILNGETDQGRALGATIDSAKGRPEVDLGPDPLSLADDAVKHVKDAEENEGDGEGDGGLCEEGFDYNQGSVLKACNRILSSKSSVCSQIRKITIERHDKWSCEQETAQYIDQCNKSVEWKCTGQTGLTCMKQHIRVSGGSTLTWKTAQNLSVASPADANAACFVRKNSFRINRDDLAHLTSFKISQFDFNGVGQIRINGETVFSHGGDHGYLSTRIRDCGKRCSVWAVYSGGTHIEDCTSTRRSTGADVSLTKYLSQASLGPTTIVNNTHVLAQGKQVDSLLVEITRASNGESNPVVDFDLNGSCCSQITSEVNGQC